MNRTNRINMQIIEPKKTPQQKTKKTEQDLGSGFRNRKQITILHPKNHIFFNKTYYNKAEGVQADCLKKDIESYTAFLCLQENNLLDFFQHLPASKMAAKSLRTIFNYQKQFIQKITSTFTQIYGSFNEHQKTIVKQIEQNIFKNTNYICLQCKNQFEQTNLFQTKIELNIRPFDDKYNYYNGTYNLKDLKGKYLDQLKQISRQIYRTSMAETNTYSSEYTGNYMSLEQYDQMLNYISSDLYQTGNSIEEFLIYMNKAADSLEDNQFPNRIQDSTIEEFAKVIDNKIIDENISKIVISLFKKWIYIKKSRTKQYQVQVNIKENDVIKGLEKDKKQLRYKIQTMTEQQAIKIQQFEKQCQKYISQNISLRQQRLTLKDATAQRQKQHKQVVEHLEKKIQLLKKQIQQSQVHIQKQKKQRQRQKLARQISQTRQARISDTKQMQKLNNTKSKEKKLKTTQKSSQVSQINPSQDTDKSLESSQVFSNYQPQIQTEFVRKATHRKTSLMQKRFSRKSSLMSNLIGSQQSLQTNFQNTQKTLPKDEPQENIETPNILQQVEEQEPDNSQQIEIIDDKKSNQTKRSKNQKTSRFKAFKSKNVGKPASSYEFPSKKHIHKNSRQITQLSQEFQCSQEQSQNKRNLLRKNKLQNFAQLNNQKKTVNFIKKNSMIQTPTNLDKNAKTFTSGFNVSKEVQIQFGSNLQLRKIETNQQNRSKRGQLKGTYPKSNYFKTNTIKQQKIAKQKLVKLNNIKLQGSKQNKSPDIELSLCGRSNKASVIIYSPLNIKQNLTKKSLIVSQHKNSIDLQKRQLFAFSQKNIAYENFQDEEFVQIINFNQEQITNLYLKPINIILYQANIKKIGNTIIFPQQNTFILKTLTVLVQIHYKFNQVYNELKYILCDPKLTLQKKYFENIKKDQEETQHHLRKALKYLLFLHRDCNEQKKICHHLNKFLEKLLFLLLKVQQNNKNTNEQGEQKILTQSSIQ